jgi:hypothetical protein
MQPEVRAAVPHEVELDVAPAPVGLETALTFAVRHFAPFAHDRQVSLDQRVPHGLRHPQAAGHAELGKIVVEDATHAARLAAMLQEEVLVAPALETWMPLRPEGLHGRATRGVEVARVLLETVVRRQVHAATEPRDRRLALRLRAQHAHVHVHGGHVGVARVHDQGHADGFERRTRQVGTVLRGRRRQRLAADVAEVAAPTLEDTALLHQSRDAVALERTAHGACPRILDEGVTVLGLEGLHDARLQAEEPRTRGARIDRGVVGRRRLRRRTSQRIGRRIVCAHHIEVRFCFGRATRGRAAPGRRPGESAWRPLA